MSREFTLDEAAASFAEVQQVCLEDAFYNTSTDKLQATDKTILGYIKLAHNQYVKDQRKSQKLTKAKMSAQMSLGAVDSKTADTVQNFTSVEELSESNSLLCDCSDVVLPLMQVQIPKGAEAVGGLVQKYLSTGEYFEELIEAAPYLHLYSVANHRTVIKCPKLDLSDDILLNTSTIFSKLPLWSLCLDLTDCTNPNKDGEKITGVSVIRTLCGITSHAKTELSKKNKGNQANETTLFDGISLMFCTDNREYSEFGVALRMDPEHTVDDMLIEPLMVYPEERQQVEEDAAKNNDTVEFTEIKTEDGTILAMIPEDVLKSVREVLKYVCYAITHQNQIVNAEGQKAVLNNIEMLDILPNKTLAALGAPDLPFNQYTLKAE